MYMPKRTKYRKQQKGRARGIESNNPQTHFGKYAIQSLESTRLKASTIEAVRRSITRRFKRSGQVWIRVYPDLSVTVKPLEVRMGKGKGNVDHWVSRIKVGQTLYEMDGTSAILAEQAAYLAASKLPMKTMFVKAD